MRRVTVFVFIMFLFFTAQAVDKLQREQPIIYSEKSPYSSTTQVIHTEAIWDLQLSFNLEIASGGPGNAGSEYDGTYYYTTRWASNLLHKFNMNGILVEEFSIPGVSGLRDLAFDGTYMYGGANATYYLM